MEIALEKPGAVRLAALPPLALYVHIPWCVRKCPYCDFNSHERTGDLPEDEYVQKLFIDLENHLPANSKEIAEDTPIKGGNNLALAYQTPC